MHYLVYGKGFQTWEYSPTYAIRSYAYLWLHALPALFHARVLQTNKVTHQLEAARACEFESTSSVRLCVLRLAAPREAGTSRSDRFLKACELVLIENNCLERSLLRSVRLTAQSYACLLRSKSHYAQ